MDTRTFDTKDQVEITLKGSFPQCNIVSELKAVPLYDFPFSKTVALSRCTCRQCISWMRTSDWFAMERDASTDASSW